MTQCQALCWVLYTNNLSCATNHRRREVTVGTLTADEGIEVKSWKPTNGHTATEGRSGDLSRLLTHNRDGSANYTAKESAEEGRVKVLCPGLLHGPWGKQWMEYNEWNRLSTTAKKG